MLTVDWTILPPPPCPYSNPSMPVTLHGNRDFADAGWFVFLGYAHGPRIITGSFPVMIKAGLGWREDAYGGPGGK